MLALKRNIAKAKEHKMTQATATKTRAEVETQIDIFVAVLSAYCNAVNPNKKLYSIVISVERGAKSARIVRAEQWGDKEPSSRSVHCFVRLEDGAILKGSWKAPVKNPVRGSIFADECDIGEGRALNKYGCAYLR
jgi:hypothetical protein